MGRLTFPHRALPLQQKQVSRESNYQSPREKCVLERFILKETYNLEISVQGSIFKYLQQTCCRHAGRIFWVWVFFFDINSL